MSNAELRHAFADRGYTADHLMAQQERIRRRRAVSQKQRNVRAANTGTDGLNADLAGARLGNGCWLDFDLVGGLKKCCSHLFLTHG